MRRYRLAAVSLLLLAAGVAAWAQDAASQGDFPKVPRRVYLAPVEPAREVTRADYRSAPLFLYTAISAIEPIVRVARPEAAQSVVRMGVTGAGRGLSVRLLENGRVIKQASFAGGDDIEFARFIDATAKEFAPEMGFVEPRVELVGGTQGTGSSAALIQRVREEQQVARPFELSATASGLMRSLTGNSPSLTYQATPVVLDFVWYPSDTFGLVGSLWTAYGTGIGFNFSSSGSVRSLFLLPGIGVQYRSLGKVFASFAAVYYAGYLHMQNLTSQPLGTSTNSGSTFVPFLDANGSRSAFVMDIHVASDIGITLTPRLMAKTGVTFDVSPDLFVNKPYGFVLLQYLTIGVVYRP